MLRLAQIVERDELFLGDLWSGKEWKKHPGRMRYTIVAWLLLRYGPKFRAWVGDPFGGIATTLLAALNYGYRAMGMEIDPRWWKVGVAALRHYDHYERSDRWRMDLGDSGDPIDLPEMAALILSPTFPNSHSSGNSEMQQGLKESKSTWAGTEYSNQEGNLGCKHSESTWRPEFRRIIGPWVERTQVGGMVLVHTKNFVEQGEEVRMDEWVASDLQMLGCEVKGYHPIPIPKPSLFDNIQSFHLRKIESREEVDGGWLERLECGDTKFRRADLTGVLPVKARCSSCPIEGRARITEERIVVARKIEAKTQPVSEASSPALEDAPVQEAVEPSEVAVNAKPTPHPAKFADKLFPVMAKMLGKEGKLLDPNAGTCKVVDLWDHGFEGEIYCAEIEPEWAKQGEGKATEVWVGDCRKMPWSDNFFDYICLSITFGNRMADHHEARDGSRRMTYRHTLGRALTPGNSGMLQWGDGYRRFHQPMWLECRRVLKPSLRSRHPDATCGRLILNHKDHIRKGVIQEVTAWHVWFLQSIGFRVVDWEKVPLKGMQFGENHAARVGYENVILLELVA